jgi:hypothetical protein
VAGGPRRKRQKSEPDAARRIQLRLQTWHALDELAHEFSCSVHSLAEEAFRDLLKKHRRPVSLREALRASTRLHPANDCEPPRAKRNK